MLWRRTVLSPNHKQIAEILEDYAAYRTTDFG